MKKFVVLLAMVFGAMPASAQAAGPYDGIWAATYQGSPIGYFSAHESTGTLVVALLPAERSYWEAFIGQRNDNAASLTTIVGDASAAISVTFTSATTFTATQISCVPKQSGARCLFPDGAVFQGNKIF